MFKVGCFRVGGFKDRGFMVGGLRFVTEDLKFEVNDHKLCTLYTFMADQPSTAVQVDNLMP